MLIKTKKASKYSYITNDDFSKIAFTGAEKINPNNKQVYSFLEKATQSKVKNAYNLCDQYGETLGILFCRVINTNEFGGISISYLPLGEDGFYDVSSIFSVYNAVFKYKDLCQDTNEGDFWHYEEENLPNNINQALELEEFVSNDKTKYHIVKSIKGSQAAPKLIVRLSNLIKSIYSEDLKITKAFNAITFSDL